MGQPEQPSSRPSEQGQEQRASQQGPGHRSSKGKDKGKGQGQGQGQGQSKRKRKRKRMATCMRNHTRRRKRKRKRKRKRARTRTRTHTCNIKRKRARKSKSKSQRARTRKSKSKSNSTSKSNSKSRRRSTGKGNHRQAAGSQQSDQGSRVSLQPRMVATTSSPDVEPQPRPWHEQPAWPCAQQLRPRSRLQIPPSKEQGLRRGSGAHPHHQGTGGRRSRSWRSRAASRIIGSQALRPQR